MSVRVGSWNIEGRLSHYATRGRGTPDHILRGIEELDTDVLLLPEAYDRVLGVSATIDESLRDMGYENMYDVAYNDVGPRMYPAAVKEPSLRMLSKLAFEKCAGIRLGDLRNAIDITIIDPETAKPIRIIGVHLDDRNEANRLRQVDDLIRLIEASKTPVVLMGDLNAIYGDTRIARFLRNGFVRTLAESIPIEGLSDFATRGTDMAIGTTMQRLTADGLLVDADPDHHGTATPKVRGFEFLPSLRVMPIDHMLTSPELRARHFGVGKGDKGSDHRPIWADVSYAQHLQK